MTTPNNIHDRLFRETMSQRDLAVDFLNNYLPATIRNHLRLETLSIAKDSFIGKDSKDYYFVYFLFEHKSYPDGVVALQILRYMLEIWELYRKQHPGDGKLPLIIPIVVYHGAAKQEAKSLSWLIDVPVADLLAYVPDFDMTFYDFSPRSELEIKGMIALRLLLSCFRAKNTPQAVHRVMEIFNLLNELDEDESSMHWLEVIFRYLLETMDVSEQTMQDIAHEALSPGKEGTIMTLAERLCERGEMQGRSAIVLRLIRKRFGPTLSPVVQEKIRNASAEEQEMWAERILDARTLDEVFVGRS